MKLQTISPQGEYQITAYEADFIAVNGQRHHHSLILTPTRLIDWTATSAVALSSDDIQPLREFADAIILLGTGVRQQFPPLAARKQIAALGLAVEVMDSFAAARTFNLLAGEGRKVAAALIVAPSA